MPPESVPAVLMRGGTSKGVFVHSQHIPEAGPQRDTTVLAIMGSPDPMQIDGLGGTYSSTSKLVAVDRAGPDGEVCYWFAQVGVEAAAVDWSGNCGNLTTAVGPFAIDEGLVEAKEPVTVVPLRNGNTGIRVDAEVQVRNGRARTVGTHVVSGVPNPGAPVTTRYLDPAGAVFGHHFPTGTATTNGAFTHGDVSIVDVTHPYVFVAAKDLNLPDGTVTADPDLLARLEQIRGACAVQLGRVDSWQEAAEVSPAVPRIVVVDKGIDGTDITVFAVSMGKFHRALPMTAALCCAVATRLVGTVPARVARSDCAPAVPVRIRHPKGIVEVLADIDPGQPCPVRSVGIVRTARRLMKGTIFLE